MGCHSPSKTGVNALMVWVPARRPLRGLGRDDTACAHARRAIDMKSALVRYLPLLILALAWEAVARLGLVSSLALAAAQQRDGGLGRSRARRRADRQRHLLALPRRSRARARGRGRGRARHRNGLGWRPLDVLAGPLVELLYPMPKSALIPVTVLWLGFGDGSKILLIFLGCMLPVTIGAFNGARGADRVLVWSARSMGAGRVRVLRDVVLPSALPELLNGIRTALALAFILLVSSELIVAQHGLGYLIGFLGASGAYEGMFAVVLTVAMLGFVADRAYGVLMRRALQWRD